MESARKRCGVGHRRLFEATRQHQRRGLQPTTGSGSPMERSLVARQAHNLKVVGSNPAPATNFGPETLVSAHFY